MNLQGIYPRARMALKIGSAYFIKLGEKGCWEEDCLAHARIRVGYRGQDVADINAGEWTKIKQQLDASETSQSVATSDLNRLRDLAQSVPDDIWVTFHQGRMWWTRVKVGSFLQDKISKYRVSEPWRDRAQNDKLLISTTLPGKIASVQGYRATICSVDRVLLRRVLEGTRSDLAARIEGCRAGLEAALVDAIRELHWKDFETLVDLVFRHAGWSRTSILGQQQKSYDLELAEPLTGDRYVVQVKSSATKKELKETIDQFPEQTYRKVFFVVHSPSHDLAVAPRPDFVELVDPAVLAKMAVSAGLTAWIEDKVA